MPACVQATMKQDKMTTNFLDSLFASMYNNSLKKTPVIIKQMIINYIINYPEYYGIVADWYMTHWGSNYPERTHADWIAYIGKNTDKIPITIIAIEQKQESLIPIGTASLRLGDLEQYNPNTAWLSGVYVTPPHRGKGIGTALIKEIIKIANKKFDALYLFTRTDGRIYKNLGWEMIDEIEQPSEKVSVMMRFL